jgi:hypothetical protein
MIAIYAFGPRVVFHNDTWYRLIGERFEDSDYARGIARRFETVLHQNTRQNWKMWAFPQ